MPRSIAYVAAPRIPAEAIQDRAILEHNARVVGATFLPTHYAPGLESCTSSLSYKPVFFGADREYADDEGWQTVVASGSGYQRKNRKWRELDNPLLSNMGDDNDSAPRLRYRELPTKGRKSKTTN